MPVGLAELLGCVGQLPEASDALHFQGGHGEKEVLSTSVGDLVDEMTPIVPELTKINRIFETLKTGLGRYGGKTLRFLEEDICTGEMHVLCSPLTSHFKLITILLEEIGVMLSIAKLFSNLY